MSYLSTTENVGFSGIPQNIPETSCATQYKMAVEGVSGNCGEVVYISDNSPDDQNYVTHLNDNFYSKFKIDPNELITFHDSDVIASEITVSHTDEDYIFSDSEDVKTKLLDSPNKELDILGAFTNGDVHDVEKKVISNGHYKPPTKESASQKETKTQSTKAPKTKNQVKEIKKESVDTWKQSVNGAKAQIAPASKSSNNTNTSNGKGKQSTGETFLDVFKREQCLVESTSSVDIAPPPPPPPKTPSTPPKKSSTGKAQSQSKPRRGRGPAVHEALQRISSQRAIPVPNTKWHAPGDNLFDCGPLDNKISAFRHFESSSDDETTPDFESASGPVCVEEISAESRGTRLALRRAALRRHVVRAHASMKLAKDHREERALVSIIKKQLTSPKSSGNLPTQTVNHLLATRGMPDLFDVNERRKLRECGWSGGSACSGGVCAAAACSRGALPLAQHCLSHVTLDTQQRLYAPCAAVFAGGSRCNQPLLLLNHQAPLCAEHAWKRENYEKLKDMRCKKLIRARVPSARRPPRRRPRPAPPPARTHTQPSHTHSLSEINVCSNSSAYDSSEETGIGALSENEYITAPNHSHELEVEVGNVAADDILDPAVLSQMPDEAFTEFFNQAEGGGSFGSSSELAAALEAVLDEREIDDRGIHDNHYQTHTHLNKMETSPSVSLEISPSVSS